MKMGLIYSERGRVLIGYSVFYFLGWSPFWRDKIEVYSDQIIFKSFANTVVLNKQEIVGIKQFRLIPLLIEGIRVIHRSSQAPFICFLSTNKNSLLSQLSSAGYQV